MPKKTVHYEALQERLDAVLTRLQAPDVRVDEAISLYETGLKLADELEIYIREAENKITTLKAQAAHTAAV